MKKVLSTFVILACLWVAMPAQAQLKFGVKGGLNISTLSFSQDAVKGDNRTGFFVGPMAEVTLPILGLGFDVAALYNQDGAKATINAEGESFSTTQTLKSIEVPLHLKWSFGLGSALGAYVATGPQFGFNIGGGHFTEAFDMKSCYTTFNVGAGVKLIRHIQIGLNYNFGISKLAKTVSEEYEGPAIDMKKNTWQISLAYLF